MLKIPDCTGTVGAKISKLRDIAGVVGPTFENTALGRYGRYWYLEVPWCRWYRRYGI